MIVLKSLLLWHVLRAITAHPSPALMKPPNCPEDAQCQEEDPDHGRPALARHGAQDALQVQRSRRGRKDPALQRPGVCGCALPPPCLAVGGEPIRVTHDPYSINLGVGQAVGVQKAKHCWGALSDAVQEPHEPPLRVWRERLKPHLPIQARLVRRHKGRPSGDRPRLVRPLQLQPPPGGGLPHLQHQFRPGHLSARPDARHCPEQAIGEWAVVWQLEHIQRYALQLRAWLAHIPNRYGGGSIIQAWRYLRKRAGYCTQHTMADKPSKQQRHSLKHHGRCLPEPWQRPDPAAGRIPLAV
mmetsp:Transcript_59763/g.165206  ORF Transcript_59763/g.165206 Transcript_59763/m.165206 type:complete len:298 (-) Transcript_59763:249-1142(-)